MNNFSTASDASAKGVVTVRDAGHNPLSSAGAPQWRLCGLRREKIVGRVTHTDRASVTESRFLLGAAFAVGLTPALLALVV